MAKLTTPVDRLIALARAHLRFARRHPHLQALVFGAYVAKSDLPELQQQASASFALLRETVAACLRATPIERQRQCATIVWGTIKGLVELEANREIPRSVPGSVDALAEDALRTLVRGWSA